ncbi:MAG: hypothetical protein QOH06_4102 [Acidobacteriota bacterium]|nr:hypothetical protein [Acidobacteriota bacterium]
MIPYFQSLGERIERVWVEHSYSDEIFARLAQDALEKDPPSERVTVSEIVDWVFSPLQPFRQPGYNQLFGEPPVMVFQGQRFYIEALFWFSGTTSIHEHGFSGAFAVLAGSSVHSHWRFIPQRTINSRMLCGRLERVTTEILRPGGIRPIHAGDQLIHQLFHLELPSVTIVVRTYEDRPNLPQYNYLPPGLAVDPLDQDQQRIRRLILLRNMARGYLDGVGGLSEYARRMAESSDLANLYPMFSSLTRREVDKELLGELYAIARERHGDVIDLFRQVCEEERRTRLVVSRRAKTTDPEARFLLALLMLMPDRDSIFETIRLQFPGVEPLAAIETWLERMSGKQVIGFEFEGPNQLVFRALVEGLDEKGLLQRAQADLPDDPYATQPGWLLDQARTMARSDLFQPLFSESPFRAG